jgi:fatty acid-binding protein DegV
LLEEYLMETLTTAIIAALGNLGVKAVGDAYEGVKALLQRKFGADNKMAKAIEELEQEPDSEGRKILLKEAAAKAGADKDEDIIKAAQALLEAVKAQPGGAEAVRSIVHQQVSGSGQIFSGSGNVTVTR